MKNLNIEENKMNSKEFNEKYNVYLEERFYGCDINHPKALEYLDREFEELIKIPGFKYQQIKPKWGYYSFYCNNVPREKIEQIEQNLKNICSE